MIVEQPWLVQRCFLYEGVFQFDFMQIPDFEDGRRADSLKRLFRDELCERLVSIETSMDEIPVFTVGRFGFDMTLYRKMIEGMANGTIPTKAPTKFPEAIERLPVVHDPMAPLARDRVNVWFDLTNDVFWSLSRRTNDDLVNHLGVMRRRFAKVA